MIKTDMLDPLITRVSMIREVVIRNARSIMLFLMARVNRSFSRIIMVGGVKVKEMRMLLSSVSNVGFLVIMLQSVLN